MNTIVNLKKARKQRDRAAESAAAAQNRVRFGQTKAARVNAAATQARADAAHAGHRRETRPDTVDVTDGG